MVYKAKDINSVEFGFGFGREVQDLVRPHVDLERRSFVRRMISIQILCSHFFGFLLHRPLGLSMTIFIHLVLGKLTTLYFIIVSSDVREKSFN